MKKLLNREVYKVRYANKEVFARVVKRTFVATEYPVGSEQRKELNGHVLTSEYYPSQKYTILTTDNQSTGNFRRKVDAQVYLGTILI